MTELLASPDAAATAAAFGAALHSAGLPVGPDRCERLARAMTVMSVSTLTELRACALATMVSDPSQLPAFDRVFRAIFGGPAPFAVQLPTTRPASPLARGGTTATAPQSSSAEANGRPLAGSAEAGSGPADANGDLPEGPAVPRVASAAERLRGRDFSELSPAELGQLVSLMRQLTLAIPPRRTRRYRGYRSGKRPDLRRTMRQARRYGGEVIRLSRQARVTRPRRLVVLCDISGSMEPYARALLLLMYVLYGTRTQQRGPQPRPEVFSFATRLTRLTPTLAAASPDTMLAKAAEAAPDWSGGTRIGAALKEFTDRYGSPGLARGAVLLIISDGWETGDPRLLGQQMARLSRLAYKIVWANPRTQSERYRPEVGGMAAAWPYCDAVVSAHSLDALDDLLAALRLGALRKRGTEPDLVAVGVNVEALTLAVIEVFRPRYLQACLTPFGGELGGVVYVQVQRAGTFRGGVVPMGQVNGQLIAVRERVGLVVAGGCEAQPFVMTYRALDIRHGKDRLETDDHDRALMSSIVTRGCWR